MKIYQDISRITGNTPMVKLNRITADDANIFCKLEIFNPTSSIKDRIAVTMIETAEAEGRLKPGGTIIEPTSGNTGLGLAMVAAARGYHLIITMPETMSIERRMLLEHLGAEVYLTDAAEGMVGAVKQAEALVEKTPGSFMPQQFKNPANVKAHRETTGPEIWEGMDGKVDILVAGVGTGGTLTGTGSFLKEKNDSIKIVAVEPELSAVLSGKAPGKHGIQGIGAGFVPEILDIGLIDEIIRVNDEYAMNTAKRVAGREGILCGISSGANIFAALELASRPENNGKNIVTFVCDTGERYLSTTLFS